MLFRLFDLGVRGVVEVFQVIQRIDRKTGIRGKAYFRTALESLFFAKALFQALLAAAKRLIDGFRRRGKTPLKHGQGEAHGALATFALQGLGTVEFLANVLGDSLVELSLGVG